MGPRCSSAETQVCHRSYIIAANFMYVLLPIYEIQDLKYNALYFNYTFNGYVYWKPVYM